jgi:hypothetical protein
MAKPKTIDDLLRESGRQQLDSEELRRTLIRKQIMTEIEIIDRAKGRNPDSPKSAMDMGQNEYQKAVKQQIRDDFKVLREKRDERDLAEATHKHQSVSGETT